MKKPLAAALTGVLSLGLFFSLAGDSVRPQASEFNDSSAATVETRDSMTIATEELQFMLGVISNAVPVSTWTPEQPVAQLFESETCAAPQNDYWQISWSGETNGDLLTLEDNLQNSLANSDYEFQAIGAGQYLIVGESGFNGAVFWSDAEGSVELELVSACFEDVSED